MAGERAEPGGGEGGEAVGERAAERHRGAVGVEHAAVAVEMGAQPLAVRAEQGAVAGKVGVQNGIEVQRPAVVVVEGLVGAVAVPPLAAVPLFDALQRAVDGRLRALRLDARVQEEAADGQAEEPPVVVDGRWVEGGQQPVDGAGAHLLVQGVPQPGAGQAQAQGDGGGFDDGLAGAGNQRPGVGVRVEARLVDRVLGARGEPFGVAGQQAVRVLAAAAGHPEGRRQERTGVAFEAVGARPGPTRADAGEVDEPVAGRGVRDHRLEEVVRRGFPVRAGPAGVRAELAVLGRQGHGLAAGGVR